ncbi:MAG: hypothetical protein IT307_04160 [Chloroflexi bacterium]|nr:hypothetical protein [Chloroflexota bacterium]
MDAMQLLDPERFADAVTRLRGQTSYGRLARYISRVTNGEVDVDGLWLYRVANEKVESVRVLDTAHEAFLFGLAVMLHGCDEVRSPDQVIELGRVVLENLLGSPRFAQLALSEIEVLSRQLGQSSDLKQVLERCLKSWLESREW